MVMSRGSFVCNDGGAVDRHELRWMMICGRLLPLGSDGRRPFFIRRNMTFIFGLGGRRLVV
jgi:hypothetical protein